MLRRLLTGAAAVLVLVAVALAVGYRTAYGTLRWWAPPPQISWCGRRYLPGTSPDIALAQVRRRRASLPGDSRYPMAPVTRVPPVIGRPVLASPVPAATRERLRLPCAMVVYLQTGRD